MASVRLAWALSVVIVRYVTTIRAGTKREIARWSVRAHAISDPELRRQVLHPFAADLSVEGAAVFAILQPRLRRKLVPVLVAHVLLWSYVDVRTERDRAHDPALFEALTDALQPSRPIARDHDAGRDGGYLAELVAACQRGCAALPGWPVVEPAAVSLAEHGRAVQAINHGEPAKAQRALRAWAAGARPSSSAAPWFELCAAASAPLGIQALIALAADPATTRTDAARTAAAYFPAVSALSLLADHFIDAARDEVLAEHSYLSYYDGPDDLRRALVRLTETGMRDLRELRHGDRHSVILAAMVSMFFSDGEAWSGSNQPTSRAVIHAAGPSARVLLPVVRLIRRFG